MLSKTDIEKLQPKLNKIEELEHLLGLAVAYRNDQEYKLKRAKMAVARLSSDLLQARGEDWNE